MIASLCGRGKGEAMVPQPAEHDVDDFLGVVIRVHIGRGEIGKLGGKRSKQLLERRDLAAATQGQPRSPSAASRIESPGTMSGWWPKDAT